MILAPNALRVMVAAEKLRWRLLLRRGAKRAALLLVGLIFLGAALAMLHVLAWVALVPRMGSVETALMVLGVDLVIGLVLMLVAVRLGPGASEREALAMRDAARAEMRGKTQMLRLLGSVVALLRRR